MNARKTFSKWLYLDPTEKRISSALSHESKNVFNHYQFCCKIFNDYKSDIYRKLLKITSSDVNEDMLLELEKYFNIRTSNFNTIKSNNEIIYAYIKEANPMVYNYNFDELLKKYSKECKTLENIKIANKDNDIIFTNIVRDILKSRYFRNYYKLKSELVNHKKPTGNTDEKFMEHVKSKTTIFDTEDFHKNLKEKYAKTGKVALKSEQNLIRRFAYSMLKDCNLPSDIIINVMDKCYTCYASHMACKRKGLRSGNIKYLSKDGHFVVPFFTHCFKVDNNRVRLSIGEKLKKKLKLNDKFLYLSMPIELKDKKIKLIELIPIYDGYRYKMNIVYEETIKETSKRETSVANSISIDLGVKNLITIYNPTAEPKIIRGGILTCPNEYFNKVIGKSQSELPKNNKTSRKIRDLLIKRENTINDRMNKIVSKLYDLYHNKTTVIIGYNEGWKQDVNMGRNMNRKFYQIPYARLINKIERKFKESNVVKIQEAYTSKCDGLNLETMGIKTKYDGSRIKRGLFQSKTGKIINADVNGAINIMRLYCKKEEIQFKRIDGINICNPRVIQI